MNSPAATHRLRPAFDAFLFAGVGDDTNGMQLSVVSMLARLGLDPWQEATRLTALSAESAVQEMISILRTASNPSVAPSNVHSVATRLVALLPRETPMPVPPQHALSPPTGATGTRAQASVLILVCYLLFMIATQLLTAQHLAPPAAASLSPPSGSTPSQIPPAPTAK